ncbi:sensor histidine kinase [Clostridioides difficile]|uniref:histidine kinase n=1 Tax=Clostridioides difficile NAP08 TaxID=525259 RepID=D5Q6B8_CLODI|nr:HAMP domain-containing sensor histidine kinase [Clostridioides difficile]EFH06593.1 ATPase/histidine kinase/DNA gyrase B/HSP90 domain protein [Clostridioides difficile NAP08]EFH14653.1 ATPase/histidine kinase/DNA gyrase B/HSP90 domain protein [Clostridioides difficile NAP07]AVD35384.1 sensor histidine kinase [Clostridioides difficile]AVD41176.1 sensor histidine kinase [Clostridioides difficile]AVD44678.1 sensor histidine kinase [Clostridioides difficile]
MKIVFLYNPEVKKFLSKYVTLIFVIIIISIGFSVINVSLTKDMIVRNNQAIIGTLSSKYPNLESEIVDIITQGKSMENTDYGKKILSKYNYDKSIRINSEPIISKLVLDTIKINIILVCIIFILIFVLVVRYFKSIYNDLSDMTKYVYYSSEGKSFDMKNKNQEGQIGLLKTELLKMTTILNEKVELLKTEKIFLNNTISDISHQLKTPMTSLIMLNDLLYNDIPYEVKIDFLNKIKNQLNRMDWLIKSMLKLSKVEAKVINFKKDKVKFSELIHRAMQSMKIPMEIKNQKLTIEGSDNISYIGDIDWSVEALVNIIKNCVEHTPEFGNITITYKENPLFSELIIKDDGEGIHKKDIPHVFKRFYRGRSSSKEDSVGIGLAMSKSIIESQNGDIYVNSEKGKGTEFHIIFHKMYDSD